MKIETIGISLKPNASILRGSFLEIRSFLSKKGIKTVIDSSSGSFINEDGIPFEKMCVNSDALMSIGGDGTLISLIRKSCVYNKPVIAVNAGTLGFLTNIILSDVPSFIEDILDDNYRLDKRPIFEVIIGDKSGTNKFYFFNDVVLKAPLIAKMVIIDAYVKDELFNTYNGDGVVLSTPAGSTAYNLSSNGPVIYPLADAFVITPISPHSLTQRPMVLPSHFEVDFKIKRGSCVAIVDGQDEYSFNHRSKISIKASSVYSNIFMRKDDSYFKILKEKLNWGGL